MSKKIRNRFTAQEKVAICRSAYSRGLNDSAIFPIPDLIAEID